MWYFVANGLTTKSNSKDPTWLTDAVNFISFAFINPHEIHTKGANALPQAFKNHVDAFKNKNIPIVFSIGGEAFKDKWSFLDTQQHAENAAIICADWATQYGVGIEIDYEASSLGTASTSYNCPSAWNQEMKKSVCNVTVSNELKNLGYFIEKYRQKIPFGKGLLTMDVFSSQGPSLGLTYIINRYLPGMPTNKPKYVLGGDDDTFKIKGLDWINIMVSSWDATQKIDEWVGPNAPVSTQWNYPRIHSAVPKERAIVSMVANHHCASLDNPFDATITHIQRTQIKGIMFWTVSPFGCPTFDVYDHELETQSWSCSDNNKCSGIVDGKTKYLSEVPPPVTPTSTSTSTTASSSSSSSSSTSSSTTSSTSSSTSPPEKNCNVAFLKSHHVCQNYSFSTCTQPTPPTLSSFKINKDMHSWFPEPNMTSTLSYNFNEPMIGWWNYNYGSVGCACNIKTGPEIMAHELGSIHTQINTMYNLASGAVPANNGNMKCSNQAGSHSVLQTIPYNAIPQKYNVLNFGGWGSGGNSATKWTAASIKLIINNVGNIAQFMKDAGYNVISLDIEGVQPDNTFATKINTFFQKIKEHSLGTMLTLPGFGVNKAQGGFGWFADVNASYIDKLCLMYYNKQTDTESGPSGFRDDGGGYTSAVIKKYASPMLLNDTNYPPEKRILGVSCCSKTCNGLLHDSWIRSKFKGGVSVWAYRTTGKYINPALPFFSTAVCNALDSFW